MQAIVIIEAPGKARAWRAAMRALGIDACIVPTCGHVAEFPDTLNPLGISFRRGRVIDHHRRLRPGRIEPLYKALAEANRRTEVWIATDDDAEGDVIAWDCLGAVSERAPEMVERTGRLRLRGLDARAIDRAITEMREGGRALDDLLSRAVPGRSRAIADRWLGIVLSEHAGMGCGRIRAGLLGMVASWERAPERVLPETGEITFLARSGAGGRPYVAQIPLRGWGNPVLSEIARRFEGRMIPGYVTPVSAAGAAVAPRFSNVMPFSTGDALAYAGRFLGTAPRMAMRGLQSAYTAGRISYPRTLGRSVSEPAASSLQGISQLLGMPRGNASPIITPDTGNGTDMPHDGLHPLWPADGKSLERLDELVRGTLPVPETAAETEDAMTAIVTRRAMEALHLREWAPGVYHGEAGLSAEEIGALEDLDWVRPDTPAPLPWSRAQTSGRRSWPLGAILLDGMMAEDMGRPSTYASHVERAIEDELISLPEPGSLPRLTPAGRGVLSKIPPSARQARYSRDVDRALSFPADGEDESGGIHARMRARIDVWIRDTPQDLRSELARALERSRSARGREISPDVASPDPVQVGEPDIPAPDPS